MVLVVEDHASVGGLIAGLVRQEGYRAVRAWDGAEAIRLARGRQPHVLVLDMNAPTRDDGGLALLRQISSDEATRRVPVLVVAASQVQLSEAERASAVEVVRKPFHIDLLLNAVRRAAGDPELDVQIREFETQDSFLHGY